MQTEESRSKPLTWGKCKFITVIPRHLEFYDPAKNGVNENGVGKTAMTLSIHQSIPQVASSFTNHTHSRAGLKPLDIKCEVTHNYGNLEAKRLFSGVRTVKSTDNLDLGYESPNFFRVNEKITEPSSRQAGCPTNRKPQMSDSNKNLVMGPKWGPDTKMDWQTDRRLQNNLNLNSISVVVCNQQQ
jgi:hypothetical protein